MQLSRILVATFSHFAVTRAAVLCDTGLWGLTYLISACITDLNAHGSDNITVTGSAGNTDVCKRASEDDASRWSAVGVVSTSQTGNTTHTVSKSDIACAAQQILTRCNIGDLVSGKADLCSGADADVVVYLDGHDNGAPSRRVRRTLERRTAV